MVMAMASSRKRHRPDDLSHWLFQHRTKFSSTESNSVIRRSSPSMPLDSASSWMTMPRSSLSDAADADSRSERVSALGCP